MDPVQFLKCILFFSLDRIIIYWNKLYDLRNLVGLPVWFVGPFQSRISYSIGHLPYHLFTLLLSARSCMTWHANLRAQ